MKKSAKTSAKRSAAPMMNFMMANNKNSDMGSSSDDLEQFECL